MSDQEQEFIKLRNVRCSFPHLFERPTIKGEKGSYGCRFILDPDNKKDAKQIDAIEDAIEDVIEEFGKGKRLGSDKRCLRDGDDMERDEYEGMMILSANSRNRPVVVDGTGKGVVDEAEDSKIYAGCYVNAKIRLWWQNHEKGGKRVNADLVSIQFNANGEPLSGGQVSREDAVEGYDEVDEDDDDF